MRYLLYITLILTTTQLMAKEECIQLVGMHWMMPTHLLLKALGKPDLTIKQDYRIILIYKRAYWYHFSGVLEVVLDRHDGVESTLNCVIFSLSDESSYHLAAHLQQCYTEHTLEYAKSLLSDLQLCWLAGDPYLQSYSDCQQYHYFLTYGRMNIPYSQNINPFTQEEFICRLIITLP